MGLLSVRTEIFPMCVIVFGPLPSAEKIRNFPSPFSNSLNPREVENTIFVRAINEVRNRPNMYGVAKRNVVHDALLLINGPLLSQRDYMNTLGRVMVSIRNKSAGVQGDYAVRVYRLIILRNVRSS